MLSDRGISLKFNRKWCTCILLKQVHQSTSFHALATVSCSTYWTGTQKYFILLDRQSDTNQSRLLYTMPLLPALAAKLALIIFVHCLPTFMQNESESCRVYVLHNLVPHVQFNKQTQNWKLLLSQWRTPSSQAVEREKAFALSESFDQCSTIRSKIIIEEPSKGANITPLKFLM